MDCRSMLKYFSGGAVHFYQKGYDYRVPLVFSDCRPSLILEVSVESPLQVCFVLSTVDTRSIPDHVCGDDSRCEYPPMMLSLTSPHDQGGGQHRVILNSSINAAQPSSDEWTFVRAREIGMVCTLTPEKSPYFLIPRMVELEDTMSGSTAWFTRLNGEVHPSHFSNRAKRGASGAGPNADAAEVPVVLGVRCPSSVGTSDNSNVRIAFKRLSESNVVFENFPRFPTDTTPLEGVFFQRRTLPRGQVNEALGSHMF
uniref:Uncharacterized protein TCIL3000_9_2550 n=1 Tax=Trypanosoma congolense (strain IL3000) TaxID=1068625 RepID=G0UTZ4_TRYCI|nr:unnamed protein product [Trypanosoma congolense IL3000]